jgi:hypothetical protein
MHSAPHRPALLHHTPDHSPKTPIHTPKRNFSKGSLLLPGQLPSTARQNSDNDINLLNEPKRSLLDSRVITLKSRHYS